MHKRNLVIQGPPPGEASKALILLHGRGATAPDILFLAEHLQTDGFTVIAPQATGNSWYPYSFLAPPTQNEPWLGSALDLLNELVAELEAKAVARSSIYFAGFSQGACLMLEFVARHASRFGGVSAFTGGLIGDRIYRERYKGDFQGTPVFIGSSDPDPHVPVQRVYATSNILREMHAAVTEKIYAGMGHTINEDEIELANKIIFNNLII